MKNKLNWIFGHLFQVIGIACLVAASWNSALLHESTNHQWLVVALTAGEWFIGVCFSGISMISHQTTIAAKPAGSAGVPAGALHTLEQIEQALKDRIAADQEETKQAILTRVGKIKP